MKFKIFTFLFFLCSCVNPQSSGNKKPYISSGFAYIYNFSDYEKKIISNKFDESHRIVSHHKLKSGTKIQLINPVNKKSIFITTSKKTKYPILYKVLMTKNISEELKMNLMLKKNYYLH